MKVVLGVDQGGTKTHAVVAGLDGRLLGVGMAGGGYHAVTGMDHAMDRVTDAAEDAARAAGVRLRDVVAVGAGMTGADFDFEYDLLRGALSARFPWAKVAVKNDCMIALYAASDSENAVILCAGTGLNCGVRREGGAEYVFGYYIDDRWQGGAALGQMALSAVFESEAGLLEKTALTERMLELAGAKDVDALMLMKVRGALDLGVMKHFVRQIDECALLGDAVARRLLAEFGRACARYALAGMRRLDMPKVGCDVALSGSVMKCRSGELKAAIAEAVRAEYPEANLLDARYEPVVGGARLALSLGGVHAPLASMETTAAQLRLLRTPNQDEDEEG